MDRADTNRTDLDKKSSLAAQQEKAPGIHGAVVGTESGAIGDAADAGIGSGTTPGGLPARTNKSSFPAKILAGVAIALAIVVGLVLQTAFFYILLALIPVLILILAAYWILERKRKPSRDDGPRISTVLRKLP
jgi:hypothetical protein